MPVLLGDALEVVAVAAFAAVGYLGFTPLGRALLVGGIGVFYLGQCFGATAFPVPKLKLPKLRRNQQS